MSISPPFLVAGSKVQIVAPAKTFDTAELKQGIVVLQRWGLEVLVAPHVYDVHHQFAGTDNDRLADLQQAMHNPEIAAIFCARGGYGTSRIIEKLDLEQFKTYPKWVCGFSDITFLHAKINRLGFASIHSPMPIQFGIADYKSSAVALKEILFGENISYGISPNPQNIIGETTGQIIGGNLTILHCMLMTSMDNDWDGKILFIEEVGEQLYHLDRMMQHLQQTGKLAQLKGLIVGHLTDMKDNAVPFGQSAVEIIKHAVQQYNIPVIFDFPAGHQSPNMPILLGEEIAMKVEKNNVQIKYTNVDFIC